MPDSYLISSALYKQLWDLIEYLEDNSQKMIEANSTLRSENDCDEKIIQGNIDKMIRVYNDVQNVKDELRKIAISNMLNAKSDQNMLYTGLKVFEELAENINEQIVISIENKRLIN